MTTLTERENLDSYEHLRYEASTDIVTDDGFPDHYGRGSMKDDADAPLHAKRSFQATLSDEAFLECSPGEDQPDPGALVPDESAEILRAPKRVKTTATSHEETPNSNNGSSASSATNKQWSIMFERLKAYKMKHGVSSQPWFHIFMVHHADSSFSNFAIVARIVWCLSDTQKTPN